MKRYSISDGWLQGEGIIKSPSPDFGGPIMPTYVVLHYTGSGSAKGTVDWLSRRDETFVSAHVVIAKDGSITQLIPFTSKAFHAGRSTWDGLSGMNAYSVGIELVNWGKLQISPSTSDIVTYTEKVIPERDRVCARHQSGKGNSCWWETYTPEQIASAQDVCVVLTERYDICEIVGHDDISPERKTDPGPAFNMPRLRTNVATCIDELTNPTEMIHASANELKNAFAEMLEKFTKKENVNG